MKTRKWFLVLLVFLAALVLGGCELLLLGMFCEEDENEQVETQTYVISDTQTQTYCTVNFVILGGPVPPDQQTVKYGARATEPLLRGYSVRWYTDQLFIRPYSFSSPVIKNITLYGEWEYDWSSQL